MREPTHLELGRLLWVTVLIWSAGTSPALAGDGYAEAIDGLRGRGEAVTTIPFDDCEIFFEINATDEDAGLQVFLDGFAWKDVRVFSPGGTEILQFTVIGQAGELGLTELGFESAEPDASTALDLFETGTYVFVGRGVDGNRLVGTAELSPTVPAAPVFRPADGAIVESGDVVVEWDAVPGARSYRVIMESDETVGALDVVLPGWAGSLAIPEGFLEERTEYRIEVLVRLPNGNQTLSEHVVTTSAAASGAGHQAGPASVETPAP